MYSGGGSQWRGQGDCLVSKRAPREAKEDEDMGEDLSASSLLWSLLPHVSSTSREKLCPLGDLWNSQGHA